MINVHLSLKEWLGLLVLLGISFVLAVSSVLHKSATADEGVHLTAGYNMVAHNDYRLNPENGNLPQRWGALPLLLMDIEPFPREGESWEKSKMWRIEQNFLFESSNDFRKMFFHGRAMMAILGVCLNVLVFFWAMHLWGKGGAFIALFLSSISPTLLAHSRLITSDVALALFFLASVWGLWSLMHKVTVLRVLLAGVLTGLMCVSKFSAVIILPVAVLLLVIVLAKSASLSVQLGKLGTHRYETRLKRLAVLMPALLVSAFIAWGTIWAFFGFRYSGFNEVNVEEHSYIEPWEDVYEGSETLAPVIDWMRDYRFLPEAYLYGFAHVLFYSGQRHAFLVGNYSIEGWWYFFPFTVLVKTPFPVFILLGVVLLLFAMRYLSKDKSHDFSQFVERIYSLSPLIITLLVYWCFSITSNLNIGHRHILITYPIVFILCGAVIRVFSQKGFFLKAVTMLSCLWMLIESARAFPHYLTYFNQSIGNRDSAYRYLVDSSLDWGQELPGIQKWIEGKAQGQPVYLSYFGRSSPQAYGVDARVISLRIDYFGALNIPPLKPGYYLYSATSLQGIQNEIKYPWSHVHEQSYAQLLKDLKRLEKEAPSLNEKMALVEREGTEEWINKVRFFINLRNERLRLFLRERTPDEVINHSVLVYKLDEEQLKEYVIAPEVGFGDDLQFILN